MTPKEILYDQFLASYSRKDWFVPLKDSLKGLTAQQASWNEGNDYHSIYGIVTHLIFWNERWLNKFNGKTVGKVDKDNRVTFSPGAKVISHEEWETAEKKLYSILESFLNGLKEIDDSFLNVPVHNQADDPWSAYLSQIIMHNIYHTGQIVTIRKLQGSWNAQLGVES